MNKAVITNDIDKYIENLEGIIIRKDELKIDDVREIERIAYIKEKDKKTIIIAAEKFNIYAQNSLLKLIEEPPSGVEFILVTNSKYTLLDTILSRVFLEKVNFKKEDSFELKNITNDYILELLMSDLDKNDLKDILKNIIQNKELNEEQMNILSDAYKMIELNIDKESILALVMLSLKVENANL